MNIAIDARMIRKGSMHGIARYAYNLIQVYKQRSTSFKFFILINENSPLLEESWPEHMTLLEMNAPWISLAEHLEIPRILKQNKVDLLHSPSYIAPVVMPCDLIMTIHDLNHMVLPQFYTLFHQIYYQFIVKKCIKHSKYILTVSEFSKQEIIRNLRLNPSKVFVTYNGVSSQYKRVTDPLYLQYVKDVYQLPDDFILCVSNNKPHKNVKQLVRAYCHSKVAQPLVLASPVSAEIIAVAEKYKKKHLIHFIKFVAEEHLPAVYSLTKLFVYPSTYEGFGLPPLEALACGTPVVVANSSSLPEVVGDNAVFADPYDYLDIARALEQGVEQSSLDIAQKGIDHAHKFSWEKMADNTLNIYKKCSPNTSGAASTVTA